MNIRKLSLATLLSLLVMPGISAAQQPGEWLVAPYIWAADVSWDLAARGDGTIAFSDIVDKLDGAGLIRIEYVRNKIGFTFDYVGMSLSDRRNFMIGPIDNSIQANVDLTVFEAGVFYRPPLAIHSRSGSIRAADLPMSMLVRATCIALPNPGIFRCAATTVSVVLMAR
jgi:hypothetical protein